MKSLEKYRFVKNAPVWAAPISDKEILASAQDNEKTLEIKKSGKGVYYDYREILHTSNEKNERYFLRTVSLSSPDILQIASADEIFLRQNEQVEIHRVAVIRDGIIIDKQNDLIVRVLDDEKSSAYSSISNTKKVHYIFNGLHSNDVLVFEYTIITTFDKDDFLDTKYIRHVQHIPTEFWLYQHYFFKLIQQRTEPVTVAHKYFRNEQGEKIHKEVRVSQGEIFVFEEQDFQIARQSDVYDPYLEITTETSWSAISSYLSSLYKDSLSYTFPSDHPLYTTLGLGDDTDIRIKIKKTIEYVQNNIVYLYDAEVMHGYIPQSSQKTLQTKSGDCKAKSLLLVQLFRTLGLKADFLLVNYAGDAFIPICAPSPFVFNHAIVRLSFESKDYFIDPTWMGYCGILEKRSEPFFKHFLPIIENSEIYTKPGRTVSDINVEETISIDLQDDKGRITIDTLYRREHADNTRSMFRKMENVARTEMVSKEVWNSFSYDSKEKEMQDILKDAHYSIITDDTEQNTVMTHYEATLLHPYQYSGTTRVFRFYNHIGTPQLQGVKHKDHPTSAFCGYPKKIILAISSYFFINKDEPVTKKEVVIDNDYFSFSNKKKLSLKKVEVISEYMPKMYGEVQEKDIEQLRKDYNTINNSNFGVGIAFLTLWQWIFRHRLWIIGIIIFIRVLAYMLNDNSAVQDAILGPGPLH